MVFFKLIFYSSLNEFTSKSITYRKRTQNKRTNEMKFFRYNFIFIKRQADVFLRVNFSLNLFSKERIKLIQ